MARTLTDTNSVITLSVADLFNYPVQLQGFAADDITNIDDLQIAETVMGVDGKLSAGYTPNKVAQTIHLQADSTSIDFFDELISATKVAREVYELNGTILIPGTGKSYVLTRGFLVRGKQVPGMKKILQPQTYVIEWQTVSIAYV